MDMEERYKKLRAAVVSAGFSVMETSGKWSIHDTSERGKRQDAEDLRIANRMVDLDLELRAQALVVDVLVAILSLLISAPSAAVTEAGDAT